MQSVLLRAKGLYSYPNNLSEVPEGALSVADNVIIDRNGVVEPRRGFKQYGDEFGIGTDRVKQLMTYKTRILRHFNSTIQYDNGSGVFTAFAGDYFETEVGLRIKYLEANGNFYFTTNEGIKRISATSPSEFTAAPRYIKNAGGVPALDVTGVVNYATGGFFTWNTVPSYTKVAYRVTWAFNDANGNLVEGSPSARLVLTNYSNTQSATVDLTFAIPSEIMTTDTEFFYRIYRTAVVEATTLPLLDDLDPGDEMYLVIEDFPTPSELITHLITVNDNTPEDFRQGGALLYTNPVSGEGILQSNDPPPLAKDIALFQNSVFYANTQTHQTFSLALLSVTQLISGVSSITITQGLNSSTYIFRGQKEITTLTFDTQANTNDPGYFLINAASNKRKYFVWYDKSGTSPQPSGLDTVGRIPIRVDISLAVSANDVAVATATAMANIDFDTIAVGSVVTVTNTDNGNTDSAVDGASPVGFFAPIVTTQEGLGEGDPELTDFTFDTKAATTDGGYFLLSTAQDEFKYFVWFDKTGSTPAPTGLDIVGRIGVRVDISSVLIITANDVALAVQTELDLLLFFNTSVLGAVLTVGNISNGPTTDAVDGLVPIGGVFSILVTQQGENYVLLGGSISPAQNIDETARALVNAINNNPAGNVNAYYVGDTNAVPGQILLQTRDLSGAAFFMTVNSTATGSQFSPTLPTSGNSVISTNEVEPNALFYSKYQQPEAVPAVNKFFVGPKDKAILRILPLRNGLFVLKEDGIYRVTGDNASFTLDPFDNSAFLIAPDSAVVLNNLIYMLSSQGIVTLSDTGVSVISRPLEDKLDKVTSAAYDFRFNTFGVAYESDRAYLMWTVSNPNDTHPTQCFRFNTFTNSWTRFPIAKTCGLVKFQDDLMYLGPADENFIEQERKEFKRTDFADREYPLTIPANGVLDEIVALSSLADVENGDVLVQTQYLTIFKFNQVLKMLDMDFQVSDSNYFSLLGASNGSNLRDSLDNLALKLDADPGVNNTTFFASLTGGLSFAAYQTDFNIIVNLLNTDSGVFYTNYPLSSGTITFEALIISKIKNTSTVSIKFNVPLIEGPVILSRGIKADIIWVPQTFGDPSIAKQIREGTYIFEDTVFYTATASYASDLSPDFEKIEFNESGIGDWGAFVWGNQNWGGAGSQVPLRTYIPRDKQKCRFLKPRFEHIVSREKFSLFGLSLTFRPLTERAYRD